MPRVIITRQDFLQDRQGRAFADLVNDPEQPFDMVLDFFNCEDRQRRMVESEVRYSKAPLAAVVQELESQPSIQDFLSCQAPHRTKRLGQAITVVVRMIMARLGWEVVPEPLPEAASASSTTPRSRLLGMALPPRAQRAIRPGHPQARHGGQIAANGIQTELEVRV